MWMMAAMVAATAVSTAMSAKAASDQGIAGQSAANLQATALRRQAMEAEQQAEDLAVQAQQEEAARMERLQGLIGTSATNAAMAGITADSASLEAIRQHNLEIVGRDLMNISYNGRARVSALKRQAQYNREGGQTAIEQGYEARRAGDAAMWGAIIKGTSSIATNAYFGGGGGKGMGGSGTSGSAAP